MTRHRTIVAILLMLVVATTGAATATAGQTAPSQAPPPSTSTDLDTASSGLSADTASQCSFPFSSTDVTGTEVTVEQKPERVTTLNPSAAQTMWDIGGKGQVVGVTSYASYLDGAKSRTVVSGKNGEPSVEKVVGTDPDLVLAPNTTSKDTVQKLRDAGITVYQFGSPTSLDSIEQKTLLIGKLTGNCAGAERTVQSMRSNVSHVRRAVKGEDKPRVLYVFSGGYTAGKGTFIDQIITTAGGVNVASEADITGYQKISGEVVAEQNPQWIVLNSRNTDGIPTDEAYQSTTAAKKNQTVTLDENYISQPAPRIVRPITKLAKALHPDAFESQSSNATANASATASGTSGSSSSGSAGSSTAGTTSASASGTPNDGSTSANTKTGNPGFGVPVALVALFVAAFAALRRD